MESRDRQSRRRTVRMDGLRDSAACLAWPSWIDSGGTRKRIFPASGLHVPLGQNFIVGVRLHLQYYHSVQPRQLYMGTH